MECSGNGRVGASIRDVLCHFFHDERIADHKADDSGPLASGCFADDRTVIKCDKKHQSSFAHRFLDRAFQLGGRARFLRRAPEFSHVRMTDPGVDRCDYIIKLLRRDEAESFDFDLSDHRSPSLSNSSDS